MAYNNNIQHSFSGSDINIMFIMGGLTLKSLDPRRPFKNSADIQTLTISSTTSVLPIRTLGSKRPRTFTKGARTFAGSMIFTVVDHDPFQELFSIDINSSANSDGSWHIDELPPFDILISATNESGRSGMQLISNVTLTNFGTTYSVDDIFTEVTYTYMAEHVSPFLENTFYDEFLKLARRDWLTSVKTPDQLVVEAYDKDSTVLKDGRLFDSNKPKVLSYEASKYIEDQFGAFVASKQAGSVFSAGYGSQYGYNMDPVVSTLQGKLNTQSKVVDLGFDIITSLNNGY